MNTTCKTLPFETKRAEAKSRMSGANFLWKWSHITKQRGLLAELRFRKNKQNPLILWKVRHSTKQRGRRLQILGSGISNEIMCAYWIKVWIVPRYVTLKILQVKTCNWPKPKDPVIRKLSKCHRCTKGSRLHWKQLMIIVFGILISNKRELRMKRGSETHRVDGAIINADHGQVKNENLCSTQWAMTHYAKKNTHIQVLFSLSIPLFQ